jgi:hypothetical protein
VTVVCVLCMAFVASFHLRSIGDTTWNSLPTVKADSEKNDTAPSPDGAMTEGCHVCQIIPVIAMDSGSPEHGNVAAEQPARLVSAHLKAIGPPPKS